MDSSFAMLITQYGYIAVAIGAFVEGETTLLLGAFAAHRHYLQLEWVIVSAIVGSFMADQLYFYLGRVKGKAYLDKKKHWQKKSNKVLSMLDRHQVALILGFRFIYGFRTITPIIIGISNISYRKFIILNLLGACIWSVFFCIIGYLFGHAIGLVVDEIEQYEIYIFLSIVALAAIAWGIYWYKEQKN